MAKEHLETSRLVTWGRIALRRYGRRLLGIPNGAELKKGWQGWATLKAEGASTGFPDLLILGRTPKGGFIGVAIEMKRLSGGKVSAAQWDWLLHLAALGFYVCWPSGYDKARKALKVVGYE